MITIGLLWSRSQFVILYITLYFVPYIIEYFQMFNIFIHYQTFRRVICLSTICPNQHFVRVWLSRCNIDIDIYWGSLFSINYNQLILFDTQKFSQRLYIAYNDWSWPTLLTTDHWPMTTGRWMSITKEICRWFDPIRREQYVEWKPSQL